MVGRLMLGAGIASLGAAGVVQAADPSFEEDRPVDVAALYERLRSQGRGFAVGQGQGEPAYVVFDPQCPHCAHMWRNLAALRDATRVVWVPVAFVGPRSAPQAAAILGAPNPAAAMAQHEAQFARGGLAVDARTLADTQRRAVAGNTRLFAEAGGRVVPYLVWKDPATGRVGGGAGAMTTDDLRKLLVRR